MYILEKKEKKNNKFVVTLLTLRGIRVLTQITVTNI
jgi:hypothetical protein